MRILRLARTFALACLPATAFAQDVVRNDERLSRNRPEAWAMNFVAVPTLMTAFGETPPIAPWRWRAAIELAHVPRLDDAQQRVGFAGTKQEDLNRSPVFGRLRLQLGLPAGFVAEAGYTPPVRIRSTRARDLFALAIGRRWVEGDAFTLSMRAFGQHGRAGGDITCPARLADAGVEANPFGCEAPSDDRIALNYYGVDATVAGRWGAWRPHGTVGVARTELEVQVDALTFGLLDRSRLTARANRPYFAVGIARDLGRWTAAAEILHVPLRVQRELDARAGSDPFTGLRLLLAYRLD
jgi:hypothetical protein